MPTARYAHALLEPIIKLHENINNRSNGIYWESSNQKFDQTRI